MCRLTPDVYSDRNERCFQHEVEHQFRHYSNTDSGFARTVAYNGTDYFLF